VVFSSVLGSRVGGGRERGREGGREEGREGGRALDVEEGV
jgi:hypothetical protein